MDLKDLNIGDMVLFHNNPVHPNRATAAMGWISGPPGTSTITCVIWAQNSGFVERQSVRHIDDPFWKENETAGAWAKWGAFEVHPNTKMLKEMQQMLTKAKIEAAKKKGE